MSPMSEIIEELTKITEEYSEENSGDVSAKNAAKKIILIQRKYVYGDQVNARRLAEIREVVGTYSKEAAE